MNTPLSYKDAGVDIDAGDALVERIKPLARKTLREGVLAGIGGFGALFEVPRKYKEPVLVSGTDGVGTKLKLAFEWNMHGGVGIDLVAMSVNDVLVQGAEPLFFLDYFACGKLDVDTAAAVVGGIARGCEESGCALIGGETAEMPGMYPAGEYDLAGFAVGAAEKSRLLTGQSVRTGDVVLGLASSGAHSNGYSLVRKCIERAQAQGALPETLDGQPFRQAIMRPTRLYVKPVLATLAAHPQAIRALADALCQMPPAARARIAGINLLGEVHHLYPDFEAGMGAGSDYVITDYSAASRQGFSRWLARRFAGDIGALNAWLGGAPFASFDDVQPPSRDIRRQPLAQHALEMRGIVRLEQAGLPGQVPVPQAREPKAQRPRAQHGGQQIALGLRERAFGLVGRHQRACTRQIQRARRQISGPVVERHRQIEQPSVHACKVEVEKACQARRIRRARFIVKHHVVAEQIGVHRPARQSSPGAAGGPRPGRWPHLHRARPPHRARRTRCHRHSPALGRRQPKSA